MLFSVYVETTVISYLTAWPSLDDLIRQDQEATKQWWVSCRNYGELFASEMVIDEAKRGDQKAADERLEVLNSLPILKRDQQARKLARRFVKEGAIPETERADAMHVAIAATSGMDYLVTWNLRHIINPVKRTEIEKICRKAGFDYVSCSPYRVPIARLAAAHLALRDRK